MRPRRRRLFSLDPGAPTFLYKTSRASSSQSFPKTAIHSAPSSISSSVCDFHQSLGMSLRYLWRVGYQTGMRVAQVMKDQGTKCGDSTIKSLRDSASSSSSKQVRRFSNAFDSSALKASKNSDKLKQAEESLRTIMFLSCWGPN